MGLSMQRYNDGTYGVCHCVTSDIGRSAWLDGPVFFRPGTMLLIFVRESIAQPGTWILISRCKLAGTEYRYWRAGTHPTREAAVAELRHRAGVNGWAEVERPE